MCTNQKESEENKAKRWKEHEDKYERLAVETGVKLTRGSLQFFDIDSIEQLRDKVSKDKALNNISLHYFDNMFIGARSHCPGLKKLSLAEGVCLYKHLLRKLAME